MQAHIIRADGVEEHMQVRDQSDLRELLGAAGLDGFSLRDGRYVHVDDNGHDRGLPINAKATALYQSICGPHAEWQIRGDVAIVAQA